jgi:hypothetical protein
MRQARSKQNRALLLVDLERRYLESSWLCSGSLFFLASNQIIHMNLKANPRKGWRLTTGCRCPNS